MYPALLPLMLTPRLQVVAPADLNGLVRFAERQNLVSARVPSHFNRSLNVKSLEPVNRLSPHIILDTVTIFSDTRFGLTYDESKVTVTSRPIMTFRANLKSGAAHKSRDAPRF